MKTLPQSILILQASNYTGLKKQVPWRPYSLIQCGNIKYLLKILLPKVHSELMGGISLFDKKTFTAN